MDIETLALAKGYTNKQIKKLSVNGIKGDKGDPGKDAVIDTTLSNSGEAADAKVVGNEISSLKEDLVNLGENEAYHPSIIKNEYIDKDTGEIVPFDGWGRTDYIECDSHKEIIDIFLVELSTEINNFSSYSAFYDSEKKYICNMKSVSQSGERGKITSIYSPYNAKYFRMSASLENMSKLVIKTDLHRKSKNTSELSEKIDRELSNNTFIFCNHLNMDDINENTYLLSTGNLTFNQEGYFTSNYIEVKECYKGKNFRYVLAYDIENGKWEANARQICFYDETFKSIYVWGTGAGLKSILEIPSNAKYIRVVFYNNKEQYYVGFQNNKNVPQYVPYTKPLLGYNIPNLPSVICNTDGAISSMLMTATDYWENSEIRYGNNHTPFDDVCGGKYESNDNTYTGTAYQLDCSSFVQLCLRGIRFSCSRFLPNNTENINSPNGFMWDDSVAYDNLLDTGFEDGKYERIYANNLAKYAYEHGYLYRVNKDFSNIKAGDLLFNSNCETWYGLKFWEKIGHVMLVCQTIPRSDGRTSIKVFQSIHGEKYGVFRTFLNPSDDMNILYGARYPIGDCSYNFKTIYETYERQIINYDLNVSSPYRNIHTMILDEPLTTGIYTLSFKANESDDNLIWEYWVGEGSNAEYNIGSSGTYVKKRPDGFHEVHIEIPMSLNINNPNKLSIFVKALNNTSGEVEFIGAKLRKGYVTTSPFEFD